MHRALDASLKRLGVETIDLYQRHASDMHTPVEETLLFLHDAVCVGKIHCVGLSNFTGWQLQLIVSTAKAMGVHVPVSLQPQYSLLSREIEWEIIPAALYNEISLLPWSPLAGGFLTVNISGEARQPPIRVPVQRKHCINGRRPNMRNRTATGIRLIPLLVSPRKSALRPLKWL